MKTNQLYPSAKSIALALALLPAAGWAQPCCLTALDWDHSPGYGANGAVNASVRQSDGKLIIGGGFTSYNGSTRYYLARTTATGALDTYYASTSGMVNGLALDPNTGNAVVTGAFGYANGYYQVSGLAKFLVSGSYDTSFSSPSIDIYPYCVAVQSDSKILIGGHFTYVGGHGRPRIARLNANGNVDTTFYPASINGTVYAILPLGSQILIGGLFSSVGGYARGNLAKLNADGSVDLGFPYGGPGANGTVYALELVAGRVHVGGEFTTMHGQPCPYLARLEYDGVMSSVPTTAPNGTVRAIKAVGDTGNDFLIGGDFTMVGANSAGGFARFDGATRAVECPVGAGFTGGSYPSVRTISLYTVGPDRAFCGGNFTAYQGTSRNNVAQIFIECD